MVDRDWHFLFAAYHIKSYPFNGTLIIFCLIRFCYMIRLINLITWLNIEWGCILFWYIVRKKTLEKISSCINKGNSFSRPHIKITRIDFKVIFWFTGSPAGLSVIAHFPLLQSSYRAGTDRSTFLDNQVSSVKQPICVSLQPAKDSSISTKATYSAALMKNEVRSTYCAVSPAASMCNTTSRRSLDVLNNFEGMAFLLHSLEHETKFKRKYFHGMHEFNL